MGIISISNAGSGAYIVPKGTIIMMQSVSTITGFSRYSSIDNNYVVASPLSTAIGTSGGSNTHSHTTGITSIGEASALHTHTLSGWSGTASQNDTFWSQGSSFTYSPANHIHSVPSGTQTQNDPAHTHSIASGTSSSATFEPEYKTLVGYIADTDSPLPNNAIIMWSGGTPPAKFKLCDGTQSPVDMRGYFLKLSSTYDSGGSNASHTHTMGGLSTGGSHNHTVKFNVTVPSDSSWRQIGASGGCSVHGHSVDYTTVTSAGAHTHASKNSVGNTASPPSLSLYFIQYQE